LRVAEPERIATPGQPRTAPASERAQRQQGGSAA
jgi:hypothetical protein